MFFISILYTRRTFRFDAAVYSRIIGNLNNFFQRMVEIFKNGFPR